ncbi:hypothetical protein B0T09DRAFT_35705 [Sordaria sp. MPI-SDFR-AT-0083]|nr:hypothetical protein B0T09DRAFT_35705 [Sordaria sp. MPI-SDFR-AT-0083]
MNVNVLLAVYVLFSILFPIWPILFPPRPCILRASSGLPTFPTPTRTPYTVSFSKGIVISGRFSRHPYAGFIPITPFKSFPPFLTFLCP